MKNIAVLIHDDSGQEARLQAALDAARAVEGHLKCIHVNQFPTVVPDVLGMGGVAVLQAECEVESVNRSIVEARLQREDVPFDWVEIAGPFASCIEQVSALADLIVLNSRTGDELPAWIDNLLERLAKASGKPLLAVPDGTGFRPADPVLIAWDGSKPVSAATRLAVPLLALSQSVTIYEVDAGGDYPVAEEAAAYLSRHGISCDIVRQRVPSRDFVEPLLIEQMESGAFRWAVIGAFSKGRIRETLFGGVTRALLKQSSIPLFIAH